MVKAISAKTDLSQLRATGKLCVVDFHATWCGPCIQFKPHFEKLATEYPHVNFCKVDVDSAADLAKEFGIQSMPTFKLFIGDKEVASMSGANFDGLKRLIEKHKGNAREVVFLPTSVKALKKKLSDIGVSYIGAVEKRDLVNIYVKQLATRDLKKLLIEKNVSTKSFIEISDYREAVVSLILESMNKK